LIQPSSWRGKAKLSPELRARIADWPREKIAHSVTHRVLNQAFFVKIYMDSDAGRPYVASDALTEIVAPLIEVGRRPYDESGGTVLPDDAAAPGHLLRAALADTSSSNHRWVEVPGIEPGSSVALPGLLRAQLAVPLLGPSDHASESV
jgi:site-specific DNA recombinase